MLFLIQKVHLFFILNKHCKKGYVKIICDGAVRVYDHRKSYDHPDIIAFYSIGDFMFCDSNVDNKISQTMGIWFCVSSYMCETLLVPEHVFRILWK